MAIDKSLRQILEGLEDDTDFDFPDDESMTIEDDDGESVVVEMEDGGAEVTLGAVAEDTPQEVSHGGNLAESMEENDLRSLASELINLVEADKRSRHEWEKTYKQGLDNLGFKIEERQEPWPGACNAFHPMLSEAIVKFQAQTIGEIFPAHGPVKASIVGLNTQDKEKQAKRVQDFMNYTILNVMDEYRPETEKMLFSLPLAGSAFRKVYLDAVLKRPTSMFIPAEDVIVNYAASDIRTAERVTHVMKKAYNDVRKLQVSGFYQDIDLQSPAFEMEQIKEKIDELVGETRTMDTDERHTLFEIHADLHIKGFEDPDGIALPYVVTIDKYSRAVLAIRRNWEEEDETRAKVQHFVHYEFIPGLGFYGFGLTHLIGGLASASTSLLRQLVDAGTLSNLPGGLKTRGLRMKNDDTPILPGEWRDVDVPSGAIRDNLFPIPYGEPSATLFQLMQMMVEDGRRFASEADLKVADMNQDAPVGTTLAIMERAMKVQSSISARIHAGLRQEFRMLANVIARGNPKYPYETKEGQEIKASDFDGRIDIIPVSDPNASTMAQKIMQYQAVLQLSSHAPQIYDQKVLHRQMIEVIGVASPEKVIPMDEEILPADPITENASLLNLKPVEAKEYQDHEAHLRVHQIMMQDPQIAEMLNNSESGPAINSALDSHVREHLAWMFRRQIEKELGTPLPPIDQPLPEDVEKRLSVLTADAAEMLLGKKQAEAEAEQNAAQQEDPIVQMQQEELRQSGEEIQRKAAADEAKAQLEQAKMAQKAQADMATMQLKLRELELKSEIEKLKLEQAKEEAGMEAAVKLMINDKENELKGVELGLKIGEAIDPQPKETGGSP